jgi:hypothetical protein
MPTSSRYTLIKGKFWIHYPDIPRNGPEPDGDTIRFEPQNVQLVVDLPRFSGVGPKINGRHNIAVRYEGIDALETHFEEVHQELGFANEARAENLRLAGFTNVKYFDDLPNKVSSVDSNPLDGYVLANGIESNGRLLGLVYAGATSAQDGTNPFVDEAMVDDSINAKLVSAGLAYVEPYDTMPISLVRHFRGIIGAARIAIKGMFASEDVSKNESSQINDLATLQTLVMWPKLFRRLAVYFIEGNAGLTGFDDWIRADPIHRDDTLRLPDGEKGNMHDTYAVNGNTLTLRYDPEETLIAPDPRPMMPI